MLDLTPDKPRKLTAREQKFVERYAVHLNGARAAREAGYSEDNARHSGCENLTKPHIKAALKPLLEARTMPVEEGLNRLTDWARGDLSPFLHPSESGKMSINLSHKEAQAHYHLIKKVKQRTTVRTTEDGIFEETYTEVELHDAKDAVVKLLEAHGKINPAGAGGVNVTIFQLPDNGR